MRRATVGILTVLVILVCSLPAAAQTTPVTKAPAAVVNVNTASADQLDALPGIGPALAARIIEYRTKNGAFKKIEDLMNVRGIGEKNFLKLKPMLTLGAPKPAAGGPAQ
jgi:competence protein ComEA